MEKKFKNEFKQKWNKYFPGADLPVGFYYTNVKEDKSMLKPPKGHRCIIGDLASVRKGNTKYFDFHTIGCGGGRRYWASRMTRHPILNISFLTGLRENLKGKDIGNRQNLFKIS